MNNTSPNKKKRKKAKKINKPLLVIYGILSTIALTALVVQAESEPNIIHLCL